MPTTMRDRVDGQVRGAPRVLLRLEGAALLGAALAVYSWGGHSWWLFGLTILIPDLSMLAYLGGPRPGAVAYNAAHTTLAPALLAGAGLAAGSPLAVSLAVIWAAHIGIDRLLGYGLKYGTGFGSTHLGLLGDGGTAASGSPTGPGA